MDFTTINGLREILISTPVHRYLAFEIVSIDSEANEFVMSAPTGGNCAGEIDGATASGGVIATLIDTVACFAASALLNRPLPTLQMSVDYLRPASGGQMVATARVRKAGRTAVVVDVDVMANGNLVAIGRCTESAG